MFFRGEMQSDRSIYKDRAFWSWRKYGLPVGWLELVQVRCD